MTDWTVVGVLGMQTIVFIYASAKLRKLSAMADRLATALSNISKELEMASMDMKSIQREMTELEDLIRTALRD